MVAGGFSDNFTRNSWDWVLGNWFAGGSAAEGISPLGDIWLGGESICRFSGGLASGEMFGAPQALEESLGNSEFAEGKFAGGKFAGGDLAADKISPRSGLVYFWKGQNIVCPWCAGLNVLREIEMMCWKCKQGLGKGVGLRFGDFSGIWDGAGERRSEKSNRVPRNLYWKNPREELLRMVRNGTGHGISLWVPPWGKVGWGRDLEKAPTVLKNRVFSRSLAGVPVFSSGLRKWDDLPEFVAGQYWIVSSMIFDAFPERSDFLLPYDGIYDSEERLIGVSAFCEKSRPALRAD